MSLYFTGLKGIHIIFFPKLVNGRILPRLLCSFLRLLKQSFRKPLRGSLTFLVTRYIFYFSKKQHSFINCISPVTKTIMSDICRDLLSASKNSGLFSINGTTGDVFVTDILDREKKDRYDIGIQVCGLLIFCIYIFT